MFPLKMNPSGCYEAINVLITKEKYPILYAHKVHELMTECDMTREEAEKEVNCMEIELELMYEEGTGLFAVESGFADCACPNSPYTMRLAEECLDDDKSVDDVVNEIYEATEDEVAPVREQTEHKELDRTIFQFNADHYDRSSVENLTFDACEHLACVDEDNVMKFNGWGLETLLNDELLDTTNCFFRCFM